VVFFLISWHVFYEIPEGRYRLRLYAPWMAGLLAVIATLNTLIFSVWVVFGSHKDSLVFERNDERWDFGQILAVALLLLAPLQVLEMRSSGKPKGLQR
jgi:hypothetical protein